MKFSEFQGVWDGWLNNGWLFESRPGVFVKVGNEIEGNRQKTMDNMVKAGFIFETRPKEYRVVQPFAKGHVHRFVCECGEESE